MTCNDLHIVMQPPQVDQTCSMDPNIDVRLVHESHLLTEVQIFHVSSIPPQDQRVLRKLRKIIRSLLVEIYGNIRNVWDMRTT